MAGITFGSVGDIIAVSEIACNIISALSKSKGSAKEYHSLVTELQLFNKALLQVGYIAYCAVPIMLRLV